MITVEEFEDGWDQMLKKYSLQKHPFLTQIYEVRHKWAKPYFRGVFCARMTSTQRSESANHMLKSYIPPGCTMHLFVRQYEKLQFDRDSEESYQERRTSIVRRIFNFVQLHPSIVSLQHLHLRSMTVSFILTSSMHVRCNGFLNILSSHMLYIHVFHVTKKYIIKTLQFSIWII